MNRTQDNEVWKGVQERQDTRGQIGCVVALAMAAVLGYGLSLAFDRHWSVYIVVTVAAVLLVFGILELFDRMWGRGGLGLLITLALLVACCFWTASGIQKENSADRESFITEVRLAGGQVSNDLVSLSGLSEAEKFLDRPGLFPPVKRFDLSNTTVGWYEVHRLIEAVPGMEELNVADTHVNDELIETIARMKKLRRLNLAGSRVTQVGPLRGIATLEFLDVSRTGITDLEALLQARPDLAVNR